MQERVDALEEENKALSDQVVSPRKRVFGSCNLDL